MDIPDTAYALAERFWPGPLTMVLRRKRVVPDVVTAVLDTVGMRCPAHPVCRAILTAADVPVAAPSGNTSGRPSPTNMADMLEDMDGKIDGIVDGGPCAVGVESTIVDLTVMPPRLLRPGGVTLEQLRDALGEVVVDPAVTRLMGAGEQPRAPGMKYRHYAPKAPGTVVTGEPERSAADIAAHAGLCKSECCRFFKKYMRMTIFDYLLSTRIQNSIPLLMDGENITTIAGLVGFSSPAYYGQIFKRYMGMSPSQYKKNAAQSPSGD